MKKGLFFSASLLLLSVILCLNCFATSDQQYIYEIENQTIIFEENSAFDQETKQYIVECLANEYLDAVSLHIQNRKYIIGAIVMSKFIEVCDSAKLLVIFV